MYAEGIWPSNQGTVAWQSPWLLSRRWDLTYLTCSAVLVAIPLLAFYQLGISSDLIDVAVALVVGGPHMYSTYTFTVLEPRFFQRHPVYGALAVLVPIGVVILGLVNLTLLVTIFMFWASIHVLHQIVYITDCYREKGPEYKTVLGRLIDYGVVFSSLYPIGFDKLVHNRFVIGGVLIQPPLALQHEWVIYVARSIFFLFLALFVAKTIIEVGQRRANLPKTLLMAVTIGISYIIPSFSNMDVAFQGMNVWHSFQYLGLTWYLNTLRKDHGEISSSFINRIAGPGNGVLYYLTLVGVTLGAGVATIVLNRVGGVPWIQSYYIVILSCLLVHYYFDHFLFTRSSAITGGVTAF